MIHPRILYEIAQQIAYPLNLIFEISFCDKTLPVEWKYVNITPIYKIMVQGQMLVITDRSVLPVLCAK